MTYNFITKELIKSNGKVYMAIPFNVWETCKQKGMINITANINDYTFECRLIPKGNGLYFVPIVKDVQNKIGECEEYKVSFEIIEQLSRINYNSPYSISNPIRKIDSINVLLAPKAKMCIQTCVAMLAGVTVEEVVKVMHAKGGQGSITKTIETLDFYGIKHNNYKRVKISDDNIKLSRLCLLMVNNHMIIHFDGKFYDPSLGKLDSYLLQGGIGCLEIIT